MQELNILTLQRWTWLDSFLDIETGKELMQQLMRDLPSVLSQAATDICDNGANNSSAQRKRTSLIDCHWNKKNEEKLSDRLGSSNDWSLTKDNKGRNMIRRGN